jgi:phage-related protein
MTNSNGRIEVETHIDNALQGALSAMSASLRGTIEILNQVNQTAARSSTSLSDLNKALTGGANTQGDYAKATANAIRNQAVLASHFGKTAQAARDLQAATNSGIRLNRAEKASVDSLVSSLKAQEAAQKGIMRNSLAKDTRAQATALNQMASRYSYAGNRMTMALTLPIVGFLRSSFASYRKLEVETVRTTKLISDAFVRSASVASISQARLSEDGKSYTRVLDGQVKTLRTLEGAMEDLDKGLTQVSRTYGLSRELAQGLAGDFAELGISTPSVLTDMVALTASIEKLGNVDITESQAFLQTIMQTILRIKRDQGTITSLADEAEVYGEVIREVRGQLALFNLIENKTALSLKDIAKGLPEMSAAATSFGLSMTEAGALLVPMVSAGFQLGASANSVKVSLQRVVAMTNANDVMIKKLKLSYKDFNAEADVGIEGIQKLADAFNVLKKTDLGKQGTLEFFSRIFGVRQGPRMEVALQNLAQFQEQLDKVDTVESKLAKRLEQSLQTAAKLSGLGPEFSQMKITKFEDFSKVVELSQSGDQQVAKAFTQGRENVASYILEEAKKGNDIMGQITTESGRALVAASLGGEQGYGKFLEEVEASLNTSQNKYNNAMQALKEIGRAVVPIIADALKILVPILQKIADFFSNLPKSFKYFIGLGLIMLAALGPIMKLVGGLAQLRSGLMGIKAASLGGFGGMRKTTKEIEGSLLASSDAMFRFKSQIAQVGNKFYFTGTIKELKQMEKLIAAQTSGASSKKIMRMEKKLGLSSTPDFSGLAPETADQMRRNLGLGTPDPSYVGGYRQPSYKDPDKPATIMTPELAGRKIGESFMAVLKTFGFDPSSIVRRVSTATAASATATNVAGIRRVGGTPPPAPPTPPPSGGGGSPRRPSPTSPSGGGGLAQLMTQIARASTAPLVSVRPAPLPANLLNPAGVLGAMRPTMPARSGQGDQKLGDAIRDIANIPQEVIEEATREVKKSGRKAKGAVKANAPPEVSVEPVQQASTEVTKEVATAQTEKDKDTVKKQGRKAKSAVAKPAVTPAEQVAIPSPTISPVITPRSGKALKDIPKELREFSSTIEQMTDNAHRVVQRTGITLDQVVERAQLSFARTASGAKSSKLILDKSGLIRIADVIGVQLPPMFNLMGELTDDAGNQLQITRAALEKIIASLRTIKGKPQLKGLKDKTVLAFEEDMNRILAQGSKGLVTPNLLGQGSKGGVGAALRRAFEPIIQAAGKTGGGRGGALTRDLTQPTTFKDLDYKFTPSRSSRDADTLLESIKARFAVMRAEDTSGGTQFPTGRAYRQQLEAMVAGVPETRTRSRLIRQQMTPTDRYQQMTSAESFVPSKTFEYKAQKPIDKMGYEEYEKFDKARRRGIELAKKRIAEIRELEVIEKANTARLARGLPPIESLKGRDPFPEGSGASVPGPDKLAPEAKTGKEGLRQIKERVAQTIQKEIDRVKAEFGSLESAPASVLPGGQKVALTKLGKEVQKSVQRQLSAARDVIKREQEIIDRATEEINNIKIKKDKAKSINLRTAEGKEQAQRLFGGTRAADRDKYVTNLDEQKGARERTVRASTEEIGKQKEMTKALEDSLAQQMKIVNEKKKEIAAQTRSNTSSAEGLVLDKESLEVLRRQTEQEEKKAAARIRRRAKEAESARSATEARNYPKVLPDGPTVSERNQRVATGVSAVQNAAEQMEQAALQKLLNIKMALQEIMKPGSTSLAIPNATTKEIKENEARLRTIVSDGLGVKKLSKDVYEYFAQMDGLIEKQRVAVQNAKASISGSGSGGSASISMGGMGMMDPFTGQGIGRRTGPRMPEINPSLSFMTTGAVTGSVESFYRQLELALNLPAGIFDQVKNEIVTRSNKINTVAQQPVTALSSKVSEVVAEITRLVQMSDQTVEGIYKAITSQRTAIYALAQKATSGVPASGAGTALLGGSFGLPTETKEDKKAVKVVRRNLANEVAAEIRNAGTNYEQLMMFQEDALRYVGGALGVAESKMSKGDRAGKIIKALETLQVQTTKAVELATIARIKGATAAVSTAPAPASKAPSTRPAPAPTPTPPVPTVTGPISTATATTKTAYAELVKQSPLWNKYGSSLSFFVTMARTLKYSVQDATYILGGNVNVAFATVKAISQDANLTKVLLEKYGVDISSLLGQYRQAVVQARTNLVNSAKATPLPANFMNPMGVLGTMKPLMPLGPPRPAPQTPRQRASLGDVVGGLASRVRTGAIGSAMNVASAIDSGPATSRLAIALKTLASPLRQAELGVAGISKALTVGLAPSKVAKVNDALFAVTRRFGNISVASSLASKSFDRFIPGQKGLDLRDAVGLKLASQGRLKPKQQVALQTQLQPLTMQSSLFETFANKYIANVVNASNKVVSGFQKATIITDAGFRAAIQVGKEVASMSTVAGKSVARGLVLLGKGVLSGTDKVMGNIGQSLIRVQTLADVSGNTGAIKVAKSLTSGAKFAVGGINAKGVDLSNLNLRQKLQATVGITGAAGIQMSKVIAMTTLKVTASTVQMAMSFVPFGKTLYNVGASVPKAAVKIGSLGKSLYGLGSAMKAGTDSAKGFKGAVEVLKNTMSRGTLQAGPVIPGGGFSSKAKGAAGSIFGRAKTAVLGDEATGKKGIVGGAKGALAGGKATMMGGVGSAVSMLSYQFGTLGTIAGPVLTNIVQSIASIPKVGGPIIIAILAIIGVFMILKKTIGSWSQYSNGAIEKFKEAWKELKKIIKMIIAPFADFFVSFAGGSKDAASGTRNVGEAMGRLADKVVEVMPKIKAFVKKYIIPAIYVFLEGFKLIVEAVKPLFSAIVNLVKAVVRLFKGDFKGAGEAVKKFFENLKDAAEKLWKGLVIMFAPILKILVDLLALFVTGAVNLLEQIPIFFVNAIRWMAKGVTQLFFSLLQPVVFVVDMILTIMEAMIVGIIRGVEILVKAYINVWFLIPKAIIAIVDSVLSGIGLIGKGLANGIGRIIGLVENIPLIGDKFKGVRENIEGMGAGFSNTMSNVTNGISKGVDSAKGKILGFIDGIADRAVGVVDGMSEIGNAMGNGLQAAQNKLFEWIDAAGDATTGAIGSASDWVNKGRDGIKGFIGGLVANKTIVKEAGKDITDRLFEDPTKATAAGKSIGKAIAEGMKSMKEKFYEAVLSNLTSGIDKVKSEVSKILGDLRDEYLKAYDDQIAAIEALAEAEERLTATQEYEADRRQRIKDRELQRNNYQKERTLAIYEGRIDDARTLDLEELKNSNDFTKEITDLDRDRRKSLQGQNRNDAINIIKNQKEAASKLFEESIKEFEEYVAEVTKNGTISEEQLTEQWGRIAEKANTTAAGMNTAFETSFTALPGLISAGMDPVTAPEGFFSTGLDTLISTAKKKFGIDADTPSADSILGVTRLMLGGQASDITTAFGEGGAITSAYGLGQTALTTYIANKNDPTKDTSIAHVYKKAISDANDAMIQEAYKAQTGIGSAFAAIVTEINQKVKDLTITEAVKKGLEEAKSAATAGAKEIGKAISNSLSSTTKAPLWTALPASSLDRYVGNDDYEIQFVKPDKWYYRKVSKAIGGLIPYGQGGPTFGPENMGIPATLHGGEYVLRKKAVDKYGLDMLSKMNNGIYMPETPKFKMPMAGYAKLTTAQSPSQNISSESNHNYNFYVDNFIGETEWFNSMMKEYNVKVVPANQKQAGLETRVVRTYNGINKGL